MTFDRGSSPLARGLRRRQPRRGSAGRIIPARAGFTGLSDGRHSEGPDHPRSRGVYADGGHLVGQGGGSSPLARGLRELRGGEAHRLRIIPARAGFTGRPDILHGAEPDHPRSRGVYGASGREGGCPGGSSPLARGLRILISGARSRPRIIPARAGFTATPYESAYFAVDHPRSRGVYRRGWVRGRMSRGSSPLARGLRGR